MNEIKHTPGPWFVTGSGISRYVEARIRPGVLQEVAWCGATEAQEQTESNAHLISAAPDLACALCLVASNVVLPSGIRAVVDAALAKACIRQLEPRFPETYCSQCGCELGPGDSGVSSCSEHRELAQHIRICGDGL